MERILIIDDNVVNIKTLSNILEKDYKIAVAKNGIDGIYQAITLPPSLILLDVLMPEMDGFEVLQKLKESDNTKDIPVIFVTSLSDDASEERGLTMGAVDYITKPFSASVVKARVKNHIDLFLYRKAIENFALLDGLTGVPNRRYFDKQAELEWQRVIEEGKPISILMTDLDFFKDYNDCYGHLSGDDALRTVAAILREMLPTPESLLSRYAGEEFALLLPGISRKEAEPLAEHLRTAVEKAAIAHRYSPISEFLTISIGAYSMTPQQGDNLKTLVEQADKHLYQAKEVGRNCVIWEYTEPKEIQPVEVTMLGSFSVSIGSKTISATMNRAKKVWLLLEYLILFRNKELTQQELMDILWGEEDIEKPTSALKTLSYRLRDTLEQLGVPYARELIEQKGSSYRWNKNYTCVVDCEQFEQLCRRAESGDLTEADRIELYSQALEIYKGDFLSNSSLEQWMIPIQTYYHTLYMKILHNLLNLLQKNERYDEIYSICREVLPREQFDETLHRHFITMLIKTGKSKEALEHYEYVNELFYSQLGVKPSETITSLYQEIVRTTKFAEMDLIHIKSDMEEDESKPGAYYCGYEVFKNIYRMESRSMIRTGKMVYLCLISISDKKGQPLQPKQLDSIMGTLLKTAQYSLRKGDVITRFTNAQCIFLLPSANYENSVKVINRIIQSYRQNYGNFSVKINYQLVPVDPTE